MPKINKLIFILLVKNLLFSSCSAQLNLIPNPSFEDYDSCPDFASQLIRANGWYDARPTPDYFNLCASGVSWCTVPQNYFGYIYPSSGNSYIGIITSMQGSEDRELFGCELLLPLQIGTKYYSSFKVALAGQASPLNYCGVNKLGMLFSTTPYNQFNFAPICNNCAQICSDSIVTDTLSWTRITGSFIADSNYNFVSIGKFNLKSSTDFIQLSGSGFNSYYYFDDICVSTDSSFVYNYIYNKVNEFSLNQNIIISPNPFKDFIIIQNEIDNLTCILLYDLSGRLLKNQLLNSTNFKFNLSDLPSGLYYLSILTSNSLTINKIIIKL